MSDTSPPPTTPTTQTTSRARLAGRLAQGVALGFLLFLALLELQAQAGNITPFRYQGF